MPDYKAEDLMAMLRDKYTRDSYVILEQVPDGTGMFQHRWIDAAVFSLWPSKGLTRRAFEIKVSRSDFIRELQDPLKHQWVEESFHEFWIVAPREVIQDGELPNGVGQMYPRGGKLCIKRHCVRNDNPKLDEVLLAGFMRAAWKGINEAENRKEKDVLATSDNYLRAKACEDAVGAFCQKRGETAILRVDNTVEEVTGYLEKAASSKQIQRDLEHLASVVSSYQRQVVDLFSVFALLAHESILGTDEFGKYLIKAWGLYEGDALEVFRKKRGRKSGMSSLHDKNVEGILEIIRNWGKDETIE